MIKRPVCKSDPESESDRIACNLAGNFQKVCQGQKPSARRVPPPIHSSALGWNRAILNPAQSI